MFDCAAQCRSDRWRVCCQRGQRRVESSFSQTRPRDGRQCRTGCRDASCCLTWRMEADWSCRVGCAVCRPCSLSLSLCQEGERWGIGRAFDEGNEKKRERCDGAGQWKGREEQRMLQYKDTKRPRANAEGRTIWSLPLPHTPVRYHNSRPGPGSDASPPPAESP